MICDLIGIFLSLFLDFILDLGFYMRAGHRGKGATLISTYIYQPIDDDALSGIIRLYHV
jgi:hypothetical protein